MVSHVLWWRGDDSAGSNLLRKLLSFFILSSGRHRHNDCAITVVTARKADYSVVQREKPPDAGRPVAEN
ncbi:hypothetical protein BN903_37 [Halorubrum sp. AJ67]|nr:hypothetical protein BN903_37 [Halorubrum sp. AJ67]